MPVSEPVIIGNAQLWLGGDLSLDSHVTGLANAKQVVERIGLRSAPEQPVRSDVVYGYRSSHHLPAFPTSSSIPLNGGGASFNPSLTSIGGDATNIIRRVGARLSSYLKLVVAALAAKAPTTLSLVLACEPRLQFKSTSALRAIMELAHDKFPNTVAGKGVCGPQPFAPLISDLVLVGHLANAHMPCAAAPLAAESGSCRPIRFDGKNRSANLAVFSHWHGGTIGEHAARVNGRCRNFIGAAA